MTNDQKRDEPGKPEVLKKPMKIDLRIIKKHNCGGLRCGMCHWESHNEAIDEYEAYHTHQMKKQAEEHKLRIREALTPGKIALRIKTSEFIFFDNIAKEKHNEAFYDIAYEISKMVTEATK